MKKSNSALAQQSYMSKAWGIKKRGWVPQSGNLEKMPWRNEDSVF